MKFWIIALLIFLFAFSLRLWNINEIGRWSDEEGIVKKGYQLVELIRKNDFSNSFWYKDGADHPPLAYYIYGATSYFDLLTTTKGVPAFHYDLPTSRMVSVVVSSLTVLLIFFIGVKYFSLFTGILASLILSMVPHFLGYSQYVAVENLIVLLFTACIFVYYLYLEKRNIWLLILTGILAGLNVEVKQSGVLIFSLILGTYFIWKNRTKNKKLRFSHIIYICIIAFITYVAFWPMPWIHLPTFIDYTYHLWFQGGALPDQFFGKRMGAHFYYYFVAFLITTPVIILVLTFSGIKVTLQKKKKWIFPALLLWFLVPFLLSLFHHRQHMVRYIIQFYAPLSLLAALGYEYYLKKITKKSSIKYFSIIPLVAYLFFILLNIKPYYLEYYNELVGGTKNVYENKLFFIGWFGEGLKRPGEYVAHNAKKGAKIGLMIEPYPTSLYRVSTLEYEIFNKKERYDYIIVNYYAVIRIGFDEKMLEKDYKLVYTEKADGADLVHVFKHK